MENTKYETREYLFYKILSLLLRRDIAVEVWYGHGSDDDLYISISNTGYFIGISNITDRIRVHNQWKDDSSRESYESFYTIADFVEWLDKKKWGRKH